MPPGFHLLIAAQFTSALADNALLIVAIALLAEQGYPLWWAPLLKFFFTIAYVVLAPFVGPLADAVPKARLMAWMNAVKIVGVLALLAGLHPLLSFAIVGLGAAAYAPAKYGLVTEIVGPRQLVAANGWLEVTVVGAALLGTVLGGLLLSDWITGTPIPLRASLLCLLLVYGVAATLNIGIPDSGARYASSGWHPLHQVRDFAQANHRLWADREGGLSLAVTTLFWGVGATLQFAVLRWAVDVLGLKLDQAAYLQAAVAVGVVIGAGVAGRHIGIHMARRVLPAGVLLGLLVPVVASTDSLAIALPLLVLVGAVGGVLVVPLNALLQHRGFTLLSAGRSIAVQGFNENLSVLFMLAAYSALLAFEVPIVVLMWGLGLSIAAAIGALMLRERRRDAHAAAIRCAAPPDTPPRSAR